MKGLVMERRLTTIMAADIVGFSALIGADEEGTLAAQRQHRTELIDPLIVKHNGRIANTAGDSLLIEFPSAVEAVRCAVAMQNGISKRNENVPEEQRIQYRIGINIGDVVVEGNDLLGDGVNIAARLEGLAPNGGIMLSHIVREQVGNRLDVIYVDRGQVAVKNIERPIHTFQVVTDSTAQLASSWQKTISRKILASIAILSLLVVVFISVHILVWPRVEGETGTAYEVPERPSIAVLPFANLSDDPQQVYFTDGLTEDLITDLAKISGLFVISRNSVFVFKDKAVNVREVGRELGVRYVLEGSVRRFGDQLRINGQLIDAKTGGHIWAENYDGKIGSLFVFQDDVRTKIVESLQVVLTPEEAAVLNDVGTDNVEAYDQYLLGLALLSQAAYLVTDPLIKARDHFEKAFELDPDFIEARAASAWSQYLRAAYSNDALDLRRVFNLAKEAQLQREIALTLVVLSKQYFRPRGGGGFGTFNMGSDHKAAVELLERALMLEPGNADIMAELALVSVYAGDVARAASLIEEAKRLNPNSPIAYRMASGKVKFFKGEFDSAIEDFRTWSNAEPTILSSLGKFWLTAAQAKAGKTIAAEATIEPFVHKYPTATTFGIGTFFKFADPAMWKAVEEGLIIAGIKAPED